VRLGAVLAAVAVLTGACRSEGLTLIQESDLPQDVYGSPLPTPTQTLEELPEVGSIYLVRDDHLVRRQRQLQSGVVDSLPEALLLTLIQEQTGGRITTAIPPNTVVRGVAIDGPVAIVDMSSEFESAAPGEQQALRIAQVVYTLTQEATGINAVRISIDGVPQQLNPPGLLVTRGEYGEFAPPNEGQR
jgi:spore germination protein GerM